VLLKRHRLARGLTQEALAERAGLSAHAVSDLERGGGRTPRLETVTLLAQALALPAEQRDALLAAARPEAEPLRPTELPTEPVAAASLRSPGADKNNLPLPVTSFIGRDEEQREVRALLGRSRLVTLTGTGGVGKTRLALQVGAALLDAFPDGAWLVELAPLADPALVPRTVAAAVGVREEPGREVREALVAALRQRQLLLVLDNCEHLLEACAGLADALLRGCLGVRLLVASREALGVAGEVSFRVPSLALPALEQRVRSAQIARSEAAQLFVERAQAALPSFTLTAQNAQAVAQVCTGLDGIPLALELAAARVKGLTVEHLASRLQDRFRLLTGGSRTALPRQQTLRAAIDWSFDLLTAAEQALFRRLAVFAGGWTVEAAEAVGAGDGLAPEEVLELLLRLIDKSLVVAEDGRYRLLETVRQYGRERLAASGEADAVYKQHAAHYLALAEEVEGTWDHGVTLNADRLAVELDNLRAALGWYADHEEGEALPRLAGALGTFWLYRGYGAEGERWLQQGLAGRAAARTPVGARALYAAGLLANARGHFAEAEARYRESLAAYRALGDQQAVAWVLFDLGCARQHQGSYAEASASTEEALALARGMGDHTLIGCLLQLQGCIAHERGDLGVAKTLLEEALALARTPAEDPYLAVGSLLLLGLWSEDQQEDVQAQAYVREGLLLARQVGDRNDLPSALESAASLAARAGRAERALRLAGAAAAARERLGIARVPSWRPRFERTLAQARGTLDPTTAAAAWEAGQVLTLEEAVAFALEDDRG
jgi:non-specific serine/threonine protein kinase